MKMNRKWTLSMFTTEEMRVKVNILLVRQKPKQPPPHKIPHEAFQKHLSCLVAWAHESQRQIATRIAAWNCPRLAPFKTNSLLPTRRSGGRKRTCVSQGLCFWRSAGRWLRSHPGKPNQRKASSWTFCRGIPEQKFDMWIALVFPRKNTRIHTKMGEIHMNFSFCPFLRFSLPGRLRRWHRTIRIPYPESLSRIARYNATKRVSWGPLWGAVQVKKHPAAILALGTSPPLTEVSRALRVRNAKKSLENVSRGLRPRGPQIRVVKTVLLANGHFAGVTPAIFVDFRGAGSKIPCFCGWNAISEFSPIFVKTTCFRQGTKRPVSKTTVSTTLTKKSQKSPGTLQKHSPDTFRRLSGDLPDCPRDFFETFWGLGAGGPGDIFKIFWHFGPGGPERPL